jgi:hypothetical protein
MKKLEKIGADPFFVKWLMASLFLEDAKICHSTFRKMSQTELKREKRRIQREHPNDWEYHWKYFMKFKKEQEKRKFEKGLFSFYPVWPKPPHRPRKNRQWLAVYYLRNYFVKLTGKPHMALVRDIVFPDYEYSLFNSEWSRRKDKLDYQFQEGSPAIWPTDKLLNLWNDIISKRKDIRQALLTGYPIYQ